MRLKIRYNQYGFPLKLLIFCFVTVFKGGELVTKVLGPFILLAICRYNPLCIESQRIVQGQRNIL